MNHGKLSGSLNHIEVLSNQSLICDILLYDNILLLFALFIVKVYKLIILISCFGQRQVRNYNYLDENCWLSHSTNSHAFLSLSHEFPGQPIDSPVNGPAPPPWSIPAQAPQMFSDFQTKIEVPHTANIKVRWMCMKGTVNN